MGKCMGCGRNMAWDVGLCLNCQEAAARKHAEKYKDQDYFARMKKQQEQQNQPRPESATIRYTFTGYFKKHWYKNGNLYSGYMQNGYRHGKGKWTRATDKYTYDGDWYMSKRQGHGKEEMPGQWRFEGEFYDNKRNGFGVLVYADGAVYEGGWKDDKKHGWGKKTSAGGNRYEGEYFDGKYCGKGMYYNAARNETYEGEFRDGKLNGYAVVRYGDGRVYEGTFTDNAKTGNGKETAPDGTVTLGHWESNKFVVDSVLRGDDLAEAKEIVSEKESVSPELPGEAKESITPDLPIEAAFEESPLGSDETSSLPDSSLPEPAEEEFDMSPESLAEFMKNGAVDECEAEPEAKAAPKVALMTDFGKRFCYFDQALYGIDKDGVLHISSKMKKNQERIAACNGLRNVEQIAGYGAENIIILGRDKKVIFADSMWKKGLLASKAIKEALPEIQNWSGLCAVACGSGHFVGLRDDGTVIGAGNSICHLGELAVWSGIKAIACGFSGTVGLREDGTVVSCGFSKDVADELSTWTDITSIACGEGHVVGLRLDGTVVACGKNNSGQCDVDGICNVGMISASMQCTALVLNDGRVKALGKYNGMDLDSPDIIAAACFTLGKIITLDKSGSLHGDMSGVDIDSFQNGFQWRSLQDAECTVESEQ